MSVTVTSEPVDIPSKLKHVYLRVSPTIPQREAKWRNGRLSVGQEDFSPYQTEGLELPNWRDERQGLQILLGGCPTMMFTCISGLGYPKFSV